MNQSTDSTLRERYIEAIEAENDELRARIAELEEMVGLRIEIPLIFGLTASEARVVGVMMRLPIATKEALLTAIITDVTGNKVPEQKIIDVFVCKARKKLQRFGIVIETVWGRGYRIDEDNRALIRQYLNGTRVAQAS